MDSSLKPDDPRLADRWWRLSNLYTIIDVNKVRRIMKPNWAQTAFYKEMWNRNIIVKARQFGFSTFIQAFILDKCVFEDDVHAGVVAHTQPDAQAIFTNKIKFMYDNLPAFIRRSVKAKVSSTRELSFSNGSTARVATSLRSGTFHVLHVSEFAKICAMGAGKARELISGTLPTVGKSGIITIESTALTAGDRFHKMYQAAEENEMLVGQGVVSRTALDYKPFFFPCYDHPEYQLGDTDRVAIPKRLTEYFNGLESELGVRMPLNYRKWYTKQEAVSGEDMHSEFPNTLGEAFSKTIKGAIFGTQMSHAAADGRICRLPHMPEKPVYVAFDLGRDDNTAIWFYQFVGPWVHFLRSYQNRLEDITFYMNVLDDYARKYRYRYGTIYLPHDGRHRHIESVAGSVQEIMGAHYNTRIVERAPQKKIPIERARKTLAYSKFDVENCADGLDALRNYSWMYDDLHDVFRETPKKDGNDHFADAYMTFASSHGSNSGGTQTTNTSFSKAVWARDADAPQGTYRGMII